MGKKYVIEYDRDACIGAGVCAAVDPTYWVLSSEDGRADLVGATLSADKWILEVDLDDAAFQKMMDAATGCPVNVIHITEKDTNKKLV